MQQNNNDTEKASPVVGGNGKNSHTGGEAPAPRCQVEECRVSLIGLKDYHIRYKICERHLKEEWIEREGQRVRFCQQCGRFQPVEEFEESKRSCKVRLLRHNARRRKRNREPTHEAEELINFRSQPAGAFSNEDLAAMQEAVQFASITLMHTSTVASNPQENPGVPTPSAGTTGTATDANVPTPPVGTTCDNGGGPGSGPGPVPVTDVAEMNAAATAAAVAGMPFGIALTAMPFVPSPAVMTLLLKNYAGMFHYTVDEVKLRPRAHPTQLSELSQFSPMQYDGSTTNFLQRSLQDLPSGLGIGSGGIEQVNLHSPLPLLQQQHQHQQLAVAGHMTHQGIP
jgi:hypothetical protein